LPPYRGDRGPNDGRSIGPQNCHREAPMWIRFGSRYVPSFV